MEQKESETQRNEIFYVFDKAHMLQKFNKM
jgi:hypothetical protein